MRRWNHNPRELFVGLFLICCIVGVACSRNDPTVVKTTSPSPPPAKAAPTVKVEIYHGTGRVTATNPKFPSIEMDHDEIPGLMPAMRMEFFVQNQTMLNGLKRGDKVEFTLQNGVGGLKITEIKKL
jgi:Cu/Ag efflux protein CusF